MIITGSNLNELAASLAAYIHETERVEPKVCLNCFPREGLDWKESCPHYNHGSQVNSCLAGWALKQELEFLMSILQEAVASHEDMWPGGLDVTELIMVNIYEFDGWGTWHEFFADLVSDIIKDRALLLNPELKEILRDRFNKQSSSGW